MTSQHRCKHINARNSIYNGSSKIQTKTKARLAKIAGYKISRPVGNFVKFAIAAIAAIAVKNLQP